MSERDIPVRTGGLIPLAVADAVWADLMAGSAVPTVSAAFTCSPSFVRAGYVLLGGRAVAMSTADDGQWGVPENEVRRAAAELSAVQVDGRDLVRIGPFRGTSKTEHSDALLAGWRQRIVRDLQKQWDGPRRAAEGEDGRLSHLAGIDWRRILVARARDRTDRTWWLPRAVVRLLDAAEHSETQWLQAARTRQARPAAVGPPAATRPSAAAGPSAHGRRSRTADGPHSAGADGSTAPLRAYTRELEGQLYSALSRKPGIARQVAGWTCAVCCAVPAAVLDHCHEHGYVRAPLCRSCNTQERPDHLYSNDIRVAGHYIRLFDTDTADWLRHWHRCPGCRARSTLPLPHLAAWTAHVACRPLRPSHRDPRSSRGRKPCGVLRVSWSGSQNSPRSCVFGVSVDFCPSGEHRSLARVSYREAVQQFGTWLAQAAPDVADAAGPDRLDGLPALIRPVIADTSGEGLSLF